MFQRFVSSIPASFANAPSIPEQPRHLKDFINCIRNGGKPKCNEDEALVEAVTSIMSVIAYQEGRRVRWDAEKREVV